MTAENIQKVKEQTMRLGDITDENRLDYINLENVMTQKDEPGVEVESGEADALLIAIVEERGNRHMKAVFIKNLTNRMAAVSYRRTNQRSGRSEDTDVMLQPLGDYFAGYGCITHPYTDLCDVYITTYILSARNI